MTHAPEPDPEPPPVADPARVGAAPTTARGRRTRASLVAAARTIFERDGYRDSRLIDIAAEAGCSVGTFYTWFDGKDEILTAVLLQAQDDMLHPGFPRLAATDDPVEIIAASNRAYFAAYARNARLNQLLDQVAATEEPFRRLRRARTRAFVERNARAIADLQERGLADRGVDAEIAALALSGMVSRLAQSVHLLAEDLPPDQLVETATRLWANALGLTHPILTPATDPDERS